MTAAVPEGGFWHTHDYNAEPGALIGTPVAGTKWTGFVGYNASAINQPALFAGCNGTSDTSYLLAIGAEPLAMDTNVGTTTATAWIRPDPGDNTRRLNMDSFWLMSVKVRSDAGVQEKGVWEMACSKSRTHCSQCCQWVAPLRFG